MQQDSSLMPFIFEGPRHLSLGGVYHGPNYFLWEMVIPTTLIVGKSSPTNDQRNPPKKRLATNRISPQNFSVTADKQENPSTNLGFSQKSRKQWQILLCQVQITRTCPSTRISTFRRKVLFASFRRRRRSFRLRTCDTSRRGVPWKSTPFRSGLLCDVNSLKFKIFLYDHFTLWFCKWK